MSTNNKNIDNFFKNAQIKLDEMKKSIDNNEWYFQYDNISDILYFGPRNKNVSSDSVFLPIGENSSVAARVGASGNIETIVIEDFASSFVPENKEFRHLHERLTAPLATVEPVVARRAYALLLSDFIAAIRSLRMVTA